MSDLLKYHERARLIFGSSAINGGTQLLVMLCLSDYSDGGIRAVWPSVPTIALRCNVSDRTVRRALRGLQESGILEAEERRGTSTRYLISWPHLSLVGLSISPEGEGESSPGQNGKGADSLTPDTVSGVAMSTLDKTSGRSGHNDRGTPDTVSGSPVILAADRFINGRDDRNNEACARSDGSSLSFLDQVIS